jgi:hypothetical protein
MILQHLITKQMSAKMLRAKRYIDLLPFKINLNPQITHGFFESFIYTAVYVTC